MTWPESATLLVFNCDRYRRGYFFKLRRGYLSKLFGKPLKGNTPELQHINNGITGQPVNIVRAQRHEPQLARKRGLPESYGRDELYAQGAQRIGADDYHRPDLFYFVPNRGREIDEPDFSPPGREPNTQSGHLPQ